MVCTVVVHGNVVPLLYESSELSCFVVASCCHGLMIGPQSKIGGIEIYLLSNGFMSGHHDAIIYKKPNLCL